jgi:prepilin-type N-terminal cleavage/methylation domain-containing protein
MKIFAQHPSKASDRAVSLIELLVAVSIVLILTAIGLAAHQGALDMSDLRVVGPKIAETVNTVAAISHEVGSKFEVEVPEGEPELIFRLTKGEPVLPIEIPWHIPAFGQGRDQILREKLAQELKKIVAESGGNFNFTAKWNLKDQGILKRKLVFGEYTWPEGGETPRTFTFFPGSAPQGGTVEFGSRFASMDITLAGDRLAAVED